MNSDSKVLIRRAEHDDVRVITDIYNDAILNTTATFDVDPKSPAERLAWLQSHDDRHPVLVMEVEGRVIGWACLTKWSDRKAYNDTVESTLYIDSKYHGRGYGRRLNAAITEEACELGFHTLIARVACGSDVSIHLCESSGFEHIGTMKEVGRKFGQLLDVYLFQKML